MSTKIADTSYLELNNLLLKGKRYVQEKKYDQALKTYEQAANLDRENPRIFSGIGYVHILREDYTAAASIKSAFEKAIDLTPDNPKLYYALGYSFGKNGENLAAAKAYENAIDLEPLNIQNHLGLAIVLLRAKEYDRAISVYKVILALES